MKDSHFFAMLSRMKYINRWGLMINSREQNDCEHSLEVAYIAHAHKELENVAKNQLLTGLPEVMRDSYEPLFLETEEEEKLWRYVKAADKISAYIKCIEERKSGNTDFIEAEKTIEKTIRDMHIQEVDYFMEEFIPAYMKTLDELGKL